VVIVPVRNEAPRVGAVVREVWTVLPRVRVIVVVNGSTDDSAGAARAAGAEVLYAAPGVPHALAIGLDAAHRAGAPWVVQLDGDGQHPASALPALLGSLDAGADLVVGSRFLAGDPGYRVTVPRRLAIAALSGAASRWCGRPLTDVTSGLRAWSPRAIATLLPDLPTDLVDGNLLVRAVRRGLVVEEVPTPMRARASGTSMHLGWHGPVHAARMAIRMLEERNA
jgi:glycosyltransferase involved in cell wall biosynthesis